MSQMLGPETKRVGVPCLSGFERTLLRRPGNRLCEVNRAAVE
jgi:hypothetical protein